MFRTQKLHAKSHTGGNLILEATLESTMSVQVLKAHNFQAEF